MGSRKTPLIDGEYYHLYNRGNSKQKIFLDAEDYKHFVKCLFVCNTYRNFKFRDNIIDLDIDAFDFKRGNTLVDIGAWVLMPNHFHLYLIAAKTKNSSHMSDMWEKGNRNKITEFMRKLSTAYAKYFNTKYGRTGSLFEGTFKSVHIKNDTQCKYLFSYIHLNPLKIMNPKWKEEGVKDISQAKEFLKNYEWSSYSDYIGVDRLQNQIIIKNKFPNYFSKKTMKDEVFEWIELPHVGHVGK